jgi:hypothetical protein
VPGSGTNVFALAIASDGCSGQKGKPSVESFWPRWRCSRRRKPSCLLFFYERNARESGAIANWDNTGYDCNRSMPHRFPILVAGVCGAIAAGCGGATSSTAPGQDAAAASDGTTEAGSSQSRTDAEADASAESDGPFDPVLPDGTCFYDFPIPATEQNSGCNFSPSDVACDVASDCEAYQDEGHCLCLVPVWGVNHGNDGGCGIPPPCAPGFCGGPPASGLLTQDCKVVSWPYNIDVSCVNHRCFTSAHVGSE